MRFDRIQGLQFVFVLEMVGFICAVAEAQQVALTLVYRHSCTPTSLPPSNAHIHLTPHTQHSHREVVRPIAELLSIPEKNVFANSMSWELNEKESERGSPS